MAYNIYNLQQAIESGESFTADEWNWFVSQYMGGAEQPDPESFGFAGDNRYAKVSWQDYQGQRGGLNSPVQAAGPAPTSYTPPISRTTPEGPRDRSKEPRSLEEAIASGRQLTADQWNWFIQQATGEVQPDPYSFGFTGDGRFTPVSWNDYQARRSNPQQNPPEGTPPTEGTPPEGVTPPNEVPPEPPPAAIPPDEIPPDAIPPGAAPPNGATPGLPTVIPPYGGDFGHPSSLQPYPYHPATDSSVEDMLTEDRYYWGSRGEALNNQIAREIEDQKFRTGVYSGALEGAYGVGISATPEERAAGARKFAEAGGGYTPEETESLKRNEDLMGLRTSRADQSKLYLSGQELQGGWADTAHTVDEWNFYIGQQTGETPTIEPADMGDPSRGERMTYGDYVARRQKIEPDWQPVPIEASSMYQPGIFGDTQSIGKYFRPDYLTAVEQSGADVTRGVGDYYRTTLNAYTEDIGNRLRNAVDQWNMVLSPEAQADIMGSLGQGEQAIRAAIDRNKLQMSPQAAPQIMQILLDGDQKVRATIDKAALTVSPEYLQGMQFGPEDQRRYVESVAASEGQATQAALDRMRREAGVAGNVNPLALASAESRARQVGDVAAGNATREAQIAAKRLFLDALQQREDTRLGAEQGYAGLASQTEAALAARKAEAGQWAEETRLKAEQGYAQQAAENEQEIAQRDIGTQTQLEQMRMQGEKDVTGASLEAETEAGRDRMQSELSQMGARLEAEKQIAAGARETGQYITNTGTELAKYEEAQGAERAMEVAKNRQAMEQYAQQQRYTQGMETNVAAAEREKEVAQQRIKAEQEYRGYLANQQGLATQSQFGAQQQQLGAFTGQAAAQGGAGATLANYKVGSKTDWVGLFSNIARAGGEVAAAAAKGTGGVITKPTKAILGERGPEMVIPLNPEDDAVVTPDYLMGRRRLPRYVQ